MHILRFIFIVSTTAIRNDTQVCLIQVCEIGVFDPDVLCPTAPLSNVYPMHVTRSRLQPHNKTPSSPLPSVSHGSPSLLAVSSVAGQQLEKPGNGAENPEEPEDMIPAKDDRGPR